MWETILRGFNRKKVVKEILHKETHVYQADKRRELQQHGDPEPPILPKGHVLSKAKSDDKISYYGNKDPVVALCILKRTNKEMNICDSSRALQTECIATYTRYRTIEEYCDAFFHKSNSMDNETLVSIDVAHYIYLTEAEQFMKNLLIVSRNETDGFLKNGQKTKTETCKSALKALITDQLEEYEKLRQLLDTESNSESESDSEFKFEIYNNFQSEPCSHEDFDSAKKMRFSQGQKVTSKSNEWKLWAQSIDQVVVKEIEKEEGKIAKKLIFECTHIPMWSNIFNNKFIENNVKPSSSAPVESEIRKIKHGVLEKKGKIARVDVTVEKIIDYYDGRLRILNTSNGENIKFFSHHSRNREKEMDCDIKSDRNTNREIIETEKENFDSPCEKHDAVDFANTCIEQRSPLKEIRNAQWSCGVPSIPVFHCKSDNDMGHYMAICFRGGGWIVYDDLSDKEKTSKSNIKVKPKLIFYVKEM
ncbi:hypothetical protein PV327_008080 [Microctonus hyperodae]|uniref:Uncharacterized protein n=1 Tax=Microctonus hyperodae TaxID=165561 RepID=A0AA39F2E0_MICHY|nr:hypothetical protein PV327_008080 [Microctonus hyperodae]